MDTFIIKGLATLALCLMPAVAASAAPLNMVVKGRTNPPIGHYMFCKDNRAECGALGVDRGPMQLTEDRWKTILRVNAAINDAVQPFTDMDIYGTEEKWAYPQEVGDCEDYVLLKRKTLIEAGFSPADLLITVVLQPNGDGHAVLTVRTDRGDFILDNMRNKVMLWSETEYSYLKRTSSTDAGAWVKIQDGAANQVSSVE